MDFNKIKDQVFEKLGEVFYLFFRSETGRHHGGYSMNNKVEAVSLLTVFKPHVPHIQVTNGLDILVSEAQDGEIIYPHEGEKVAQNIAKLLPKFEVPSGPQALNNTLKQYRQTLKHYKEVHQKYQNVYPTLVQETKEQLMMDELTLRALAARDDINLYKHAYEPSPLALGEHLDHNQNKGFGMGLDMSF